MRKIFDVELSAQNCCTELALPATPWSMQDALEKLKLREDESLHCEILRIHSCGALYPYLKHADALFELNALCQQLALLDEAQISILEGLVKMEYGQQDEQPAPLSRLIDMACSTDCCHFLAGITTDVQLGRFCAENGFVPEVDNLPDTFFEMLNFEQIGRDFRQNEGGIFTRDGYVQRYEELRQVYGTLDLTLKKPDHTALVQTASGCEVKLPVPLGDPTGDEPVLCLDCAAPALIGLSGTMATWDLLAHRLAELEVDGELPKYKAVLEVIDCDDICWALSLTDELEQYMLDTKKHTPEEVARGAIDMTVPHREIESLLPHVNLYQYGQSLIQAGGGALTEYGLIERTDGQPVQAIDQEQSQTGGMSFA